MTTPNDSQRKLHFDLTNVGLRAQATAVGLVQLCIELQRTKVLDEAAVERIKQAIADEVSLSAPRSISAHKYRTEIKTRLDQLFAGGQEIGSADALAFGASTEDKLG
jgi:hypothetical protein